MPRRSLTAIEVIEQATPSNPASGYVLIYAKADGKLYIKDDAGVETDLTASSGVTQEDIQDIVGGMVTGNTETNMSVTYDDTNGKLNFDLAVILENINVRGAASGGTGLSVNKGSVTNRGLVVYGGDGADTQPIVEIWDEFSVGAETMVVSVDKNGYLSLRKVAAPADADIVNSEVKFWWDATAGTLNVKGKTSGGTVVNTALPTQEQIEDIVGAMVTGNTETNITVTYDDSTGKLNFVASGGAAPSFGALERMRVD